MTDVSQAKQLASFLSGAHTHNRTGLLLLADPWLGRELEVAARLQISYADVREHLLRRVAPDQRYLGVDWQELIGRDLDELVRRSQPDGGCLLVANLDIPLCSLPMQDRIGFWSFLRTSYRPAWGLLLTLPASTRRLVPDSELCLWASAGRLAAWEEVFKQL